MYTPHGNAGGHRMASMHTQSRSRKRGRQTDNAKTGASGVAEARTELSEINGSSLAPAAATPAAASTAPHCTARQHKRTRRKPGNDDEASGAGTARQSPLATTRTTRVGLPAPHALPATVAVHRAQIAAAASSRQLARRARQVAKVHAHLIVR